MADSSLVYPICPGDIKKGAYVVIKDFPCKVDETTHSKVGKHGSAKTHVVGIDIFTNKKYEHTWSSSQQMEVPYIKKTNYTIMDFNDDGFITLIDDKNQTREDLQIPDSNPLYHTIKTRLDLGDELIAIVISAMGHEQITEIKTATN